MPIAEASPGVSLAYEAFGDPADPAVLLVMGFGTRLIAWHEDFCRALARRGRHVIRYDNRDCGLSTTFDDHPVDMGRFIAAEPAAQSYDRACRPSGIGRQLGAMVLGGSRADALRELRVPTLVMHGLDDTLIDPSGGKWTAGLVPGAKLLLIPDMGHDRPRELWPEIIDAVAAHTPLSTRRGRLRPRFQ
ncbi:alpha/beta fold hydrolase [Streptomyces sp. NPDC058471]|uniref:alpha/beta fold hydrolase n=1 Tax=Streptomyces sp. NPDC058471 TaxID=3346516 RepID=UPI00365C5E32